MLRFTEPIPQELDKGAWSQRLGHLVKRWMQSVEDSLGGLQGTPTTPTRIEAGVAADPGTSQAAAPSDHIHNIQTAAPSLKVQLGGAQAEGTAHALLRSDSKQVLDSGGATDGQTLIYNTAAGAWQPGDAGGSGDEILSWLDL